MFKYINVQNFYYLVAVPSKYCLISIKFVEFAFVFKMSSSDTSSNNMSSDDSSVISSDMNRFTGHVLDHVLTDSPKIIELKRKRDLVLYSSSDCEESVSDDFVPKLPTIDFATLNNSTPNTLHSDYDSISSNEDDDDAEILAPLPIQKELI